MLGVSKLLKDKPATRRRWRSRLDFGFWPTEHPAGRRPTAVLFELVSNIESYEATQRPFHPVSQTWPFAHESVGENPLWELRVRRGKSGLGLRAKNECEGVAPERFVKGFQREDGWFAPSPLMMLLPLPQHQHRLSSDGGTEWKWEWEKEVRPQHLKIIPDL